MYYNQLHIWFLKRAIGKWSQISHTGNSDNTDNAGAIPVINSAKLSEGWDGDEMALSTNPGPVPFPAWGNEGEVGQ